MNEGLWLYKNNINNCYFLCLKNITQKVYFNWLYSVVQTLIWSFKSRIYSISFELIGSMSKKKIVQERLTMKSSITAFNCVYFLSSLSVPWIHLLLKILLSVQCESEKKGNAYVWGKNLKFKKEKMQKSKKAKRDSNR